MFRSKFEISYLSVANKQPTPVLYPAGLRDGRSRCVRWAQVVRPLSRWAGAGGRPVPARLRGAMISSCAIATGSIRRKHSLYGTRVSLSVCEWCED